MGSTVCLNGVKYSFVYISIVLFTYLQMWKLCKDMDLGRHIVGHTAHVYTHMYIYVYLYIRIYTYTCVAQTHVSGHVSNCIAWAGLLVEFCTEPVIFGHLISMSDRCMYNVTVSVCHSEHHSVTSQ